MFYGEGGGRRIAKGEEKKYYARGSREEYSKPRGEEVLQSVERGWVVAAHSRFKTGVGAY